MRVHQVSLGAYAYAPRCTCTSSAACPVHASVCRQLDGTLSDCLFEESVVLLKRATWFQEHVRVRTIWQQLIALAPVPFHSPANVRLFKGATNMNQTA